MSDIESWFVRGGITAAIAALVGLFMRVRTNESRLAVLEKEDERNRETQGEVGDLKVLAAEINTKLDYLPRHDDLQRIHDRISKNGTATSATREEIAALKAEVEGTREAVKRLEQAELNRGSR